MSTNEYLPFSFATPLDAIKHLGQMSHNFGVKRQLWFLPEEVIPCLRTLSIATQTIEAYRRKIGFLVETPLVDANAHIVPSNEECLAGPCLH